MAIKGLIFDLDGTVTITQQYHAQTFAAVFKKHGLKYTARDDARYSGRGSHCTFPEFFKEHGIILTKKQIEEYSKEKRILYDKLIKTVHLKNVPGIETFLEKQKAKGIKIAMATGNRIDAARLILKKTGLLKFFKIIVTNKDVKNSKPFPDIFLKAAKKLNLKPQECIIFEDAVNGVEAAKSGGIRCIALTTGTPAEKLLAAGADHLIANYRRVSPEFLK